MAERGADTFIDDCLLSSREERYARWILLHFRLPAHGNDFLEFLEGKRLFCTYQGKRYRVTMASRFGHIGLSPDFDREAGYDETAEPYDCTDWSDHA